MTIHSYYDPYKCKKCGEIFIPFKKSLPCPACGVAAAEHYDLVGDIIYNMGYCRKRGSGKDLFPSMFGITSFADQLQVLMFSFFRDIEENKPADADKYVWETIDAYKDTPESRKKHLYDIYLAVKPEYEKLKAEFALIGKKRAVKWKIFYAVIFLLFVLAAFYFLF